jgi:uncharacterized protein
VSMHSKEMRRKDRQTTEQEARQLLSCGEYGVLSTVGSDGQPYGVPLNYAYRELCIYFHCATTGHKLENLADNQRAAFCVVGKTKVLPDKYSTEYESAIAFGRISEVQGSEKARALLWLLEKYSPEDLDAGKQYIGQKGDATKVMKMDIEHLSGKARR